MVYVQLYMRWVGLSNFDHYQLAAATYIHIIMMYVPILAISELYQ